MNRTVSIDEMDSAIMDELSPQFQNRYAVRLNQFLITKMLKKGGAKA